MSETHKEEIMNALTATLSSAHIHDEPCLICTRSRQSVCHTCFLSVLREVLRDSSSSSRRFTDFCDLFNYSPPRLQVIQLPA